MDAFGRLKQCARSDKGADINRNWAFFVNTDVSRDELKTHPGSYDWRSRPNCLAFETILSFTRRVEIDERSNVQLDPMHVVEIDKKYSNIIELFQRTAFQSFIFSFSCKIRR